jgi:hypothetical protein
VYELKFTSDFLFMIFFLLLRSVRSDFLSCIGQRAFYIHCRYKLVAVYSHLSIISLDARHIEEFYS